MSHSEWGRVEVISGCMTSGKSLELLYRLEQIKRQMGSATILAFRHYQDNRGELGVVSSRDGQRLKATVVRDTKEIVALTLGTPGITAVGIDEVMFYEHDVVKAARTLANRGIRVICAGLDTDCYGEPFGPMPRLLADSEITDKRYSWCCQCRRVRSFSMKAWRTQWIGEGAPPLPGEKRPGGDKLFEPRCHECFVPPVLATVSSEIT